MPPSRYFQEDQVPLTARMVSLGAALLRWAKVWTHDLDVAGTATVPTPVNGTDAATKDYVDSLFNPTIATVEEADGSPQITLPTTIRLDQTDGFVLTEPSAGIARIDLSAVPNAVLANSSITVTAGTGLATGGAVSLGGSVTLDLATPVAVANGGTGLASGTSGGVLAYTAAGTLASSAALTLNGVVLGGGAGAVPTSTAAGAASQVLRVPSGGGTPVFSSITTGFRSFDLIRKTADETVNNSNSLQDDDHLLAALAANEIVAFECFVIFDAATAADIQFAFTVPASGVIAWNFAGGVLVDGTLTVARANATVASGGAVGWGGYGAGTKAAVLIVGTVVNSSTPGNLQFQWAQSNADASDAKVYTNSWLKVYRST